MGTGLSNKNFQGTLSQGGQLVVVTNDGRLADARTPKPHNSTHNSTGSDPVALDASQTTSGQFVTGLLGTGTANASSVLRGDGTWKNPFTFSCTSTTRPSGPFAGQIINETDTGNTLIYDAGAGAWYFVNGRARLTSAQRTGATSTTTTPLGSTQLINGLEVYETDTGKTFVYQGGSWVQLSATGPADLQYAEITANSAAVNTTTATDVTGLSVSVTTASRPVMVEAEMQLAHTATGTSATVAFYLVEDGTIIQTGIRTDTTNVQGGIHRARRRSPAAGAHTYKVQIATNNATAGVQVIATAQSTAWIRVYETG